MTKHFIILSSSYSEGKRIARHYVIDDVMDASWIMQEIETIKSFCGESVSISTHYVTTESADWMSVVQKDAFFADVDEIETLTEFIKLIQIDRRLKGLDIAKYILTKYVCTHLKLEKLVYLCYADYLCITGSKLFDDQIYAFKYGPVVKSVNEKYRGSSDEIEEEIDDNCGVMAARSRILFATDGIERIKQIDITLSKYGECSASKLVDITHSQGGPWDSTDKKTKFSEISDDIILKKHMMERI